MLLDVFWLLPARALRVLGDLGEHRPPDRGSKAPLVSSTCVIAASLKSHCSEAPPNPVATRGPVIVQMALPPAWPPSWSGLPLLLRNRQLIGDRVTLRLTTCNFFGGPSLLF